MSTTGSFYQGVDSSTQYDDRKKDDAIPSGAAPMLYKVNPDEQLTPNTTGYTTSTNQLTTSGK